MTQKELSQLKHLQSEIKLLEKRASEIEEVLNEKPTVHGCVTGSMDLAPFIKRSISISGADPADFKEASEHFAELSALNRLINERKGRCLTEYGKLMGYINGVDDSLVRQIMQLKYIEGLNWSQIEYRIGGGNNAEGLRKRLNRYLSKSCPTMSVSNRL